jgi:hypothetical protein
MPTERCILHEMEAWLDSALARFDNDNALLAGRTRALLTRAAGDSELHARLLNTLSLLEHMGSHKIVATQTGRTVDQPTLRHIAEEAHHAWFMKRQAEKTAARGMTYEAQDLLAPAAARMYFQRLEAVMLRSLTAQHSAHATYLYMSMIVEFRALWFYELYEQVLREGGYPLSLKRVLGEERNHLHEVAHRLDAAGELADARVADFTGHETLLYRRMLVAMEIGLSAAPETDAAQTGHATTLRSRPQASGTPALRKAGATF